MIPAIVRKKKREHPLESKVEAYFKKQAGLMGAATWKFSSPNQRGVSDQILVLNGIVIFVEIKAVKGKISPKQESFHHKIVSKSGLSVFVFGHSGVDAFIQALKTLELTIISAEQFRCPLPLSAYQHLIEKEYH